jgi:hypothetical protein
MLDMNDIVLIACFTCIASAIFSLLFAVMSHFLRNRDVERLQGVCERIEKSVAGSVGRASREQNSERMNEAIAKVALLIKEGKQPADAIKAVAGEYPDVALMVGKKMLTGQLKL